MIPKNIRAEIENSCLTIKDEKGELISKYQLDTLATALRTGRVLETERRQAAGIALQVLLERVKEHLGVDTETGHVK